MAFNTGIKQRVIQVTTLEGKKHLMLKKSRPKFDEAVTVSVPEPEFSEKLEVLSSDGASLDVDSSLAADSEDNNKENVSDNIQKVRNANTTSSFNKPRESILAPSKSVKLDGKELDCFSFEPKPALRLQNTRKFVPKMKQSTTFTEFKIDFAISSEATL
jgi:hypothetical protein